MKCSVIIVLGHKEKAQWVVTNNWSETAFEPKGVSIWSKPSSMTQKLKREKLRYLAYFTRDNIFKGTERFFSWELFFQRTHVQFQTNGKIISEICDEKMPSKRKKGGLSRLLCGCFKSETTSAKYDIAEPAPIERANHITEILGKISGEIFSKWIFFYFRSKFGSNVDATRSRNK